MAKMMEDKGCICKGNWRKIIKDCESLFGKKFKDSNDLIYRFIGVMHGDDDYYYCMWRYDDLRLLSCVSSIEKHGFSEIIRKINEKTKIVPG